MLLISSTSFNLYSAIIELHAKYFYSEKTCYRWYGQGYTNNDRKKDITYDILLYRFGECFHAKNSVSIPMTCVRYSLLVARFLMDEIRKILLETSDVLGIIVFFNRYINIE